MLEKINWDRAVVTGVAFAAVGALAASGAIVEMSMKPSTPADIRPTDNYSSNSPGRTAGDDDRAPVVSYTRHPSDISNVVIGLSHP